MTWWNDQVVPRATDLLLGSGEIARLRERVCAGLSGEVLEIGFGSGLTMEHYPPAVTKVLAVEPSDVAWRIAEAKHTGAGRPTVVRAGLDGQSLDLPDASVDAVVSAFTLCTIPDVVAALRELRRVLRPGGELRFVEHGLSPDNRVARWQRWLTPIQQRVAAGCHLDRDPTALVAGAGLEICELETFYLGGGVPGTRVATYLYLGRAVRPGSGDR